MADKYVQVRLKSGDTERYCYVNMPDIKKGMFVTLKKDEGDAKAEIIWSVEWVSMLEAIEAVEINRGWHNNV